MTKMEQRKAILDGMKDLQTMYKKHGLGENFQIMLAWKIIREAMEMKPEKISTYYVDGGIGAPNYKHKKAVYSKDDNRKVATVIKRMAEQGFIRLSESGKSFTVLF